MPVLDRDGRRLHHLDEGSGPPVVLLHAFPLHAAMWEPQVEALARRWRVVAPDLAGFGGSDEPGDPTACSVDAFAGDVAALVEHLGLTRPAVLGLSLGGYVAFALLRRDPRLAGALVLCDTRSGPDTPEHSARRTEQQRQLRESGDVGPLADAMCEALIRTTTDRESVVRRARSLMVQNSPAGLAGALEAMKRRPDSTPLLGRVEVPALFVVGEHDPTTPPEVAREMTELTPGARLAVVPDAGHLSSMENPAAFNASVEEFLASL